MEHELEWSSPFLSFLSFFSARDFDPLADSADEESIQTEEGRPRLIFFNGSASSSETGTSLLYSLFILPFFPPLLSSSAFVAWEAEGSTEIGWAAISHFGRGPPLQVPLLRIFNTNRPPPK